MPWSARILAVLAALLAAVASFAGIGGSVYSTAELQYRVQWQGQDLVTLALAVPLILYNLRGSQAAARRQLLVLGLLVYLLYTYASYALLLPLTPLFLLHVAIFAATLFAVLVSLVEIDAPRVRASFDPRTPRITPALTCILTSLAVALLWLGGLLGPVLAPNWIAPEFLEDVRKIQPILLLDFGILVPLGMLAGVELLLDHAWGFVLAPLFLVKVASLFLALVLMTAFMFLAGVPLPPGTMTALWVLLLLVTGGPLLLLLSRADSSAPA